MVCFIVIFALLQYLLYCGGLEPNPQHLEYINTKMAPISQGRAAAAAKSRQSCPTLCDPIDGSPPGSPVPGIFQSRTLEWVAISFSNAWKWKVKVKSLSLVWLLATPWTVAYQAPPSMGFSRQEYWSGVPLPSPQGRARPPQVRERTQLWKTILSCIFSAALWTRTYQMSPYSVSNPHTLEAENQELEY